MSLLSDVLPRAALALALLAGSAHAAPYWSSDQVRIARPTAASQMLNFDMRFERTEGDKPASVELSSVSLAQDFNHLMSGDAHKLDDFRLCETLTWQAGAATVDSNSCHAFPTFLVYELQNRLALTKIVASAPGADSDPAWNEADMGLSLRPGAPLKVVRKGDATEYRLGDTLVASVSGDAGRASPEEMRRLVRLLARHVPMHPQVRQAIGARTTLPARIELHSRVVGAVPTRQVVTISNARRVSAEYPLPTGLGSSLRASIDDTRRGKGVARALAVIDSGGKDAPPPLQTLIRDMQQTKAPLETMTLFLNITQQYPAAFRPGPDDSREKIMPKLRQAMTDHETLLLFAANDLAGDQAAKGDREAAGRFLANARKMDAMQFGTFRYVTYANLALNSPSSETWDPAIRSAMPNPITDNYWVHISAYPWAGNTYGDLGGAYTGLYETGQAWIAYDLGRAVDPQWRLGVLGNIEKLERRLTRDFPDFY